MSIGEIVFVLVIQEIEVAVVGENARGIHHTIPLIKLLSHRCARIGADIHHVPAGSEHYLVKITRQITINPVGRAAQRDHLPDDITVVQFADQQQFSVRKFLDFMHIWQKAVDAVMIDIAIVYAIVRTDGQLNRRFHQLDTAVPGNEIGGQHLRTPSVAAHHATDDESSVFQQRLGTTEGGLRTKILRDILYAVLVIHRNVQGVLRLESHIFVTSVFSDVDDTVIGHHDRRIVVHPIMHILSVVPKQVPVTAEYSHILNVAYIAFRFRVEDRQYREL